MRASIPLLAIGLVLPLVPIASAYDPANPANFTWEETGVLAVGGGGLYNGGVDTVYNNGFRAIVDLRAEHVDPASYIASKGMSFLDMPIDHAVDMNVTQVKQFVAWVEARKAEGRPVYAHCTNGWHRAAAMATAWEMKRTGLSYDDASDRVEARRAGTVMRAPHALLEYDAYLDGRSPLTVIMTAPKYHPERGSTMTVTVEVRAGAVPASGAAVRIWSEESGLRVSGTAGSDGRFSFTYRAPSSAPMDHLYARAGYGGWPDGADAVELFYQTQPAAAGSPLSVTGVVKNGVLEVAARKGDGSLAKGARVLAYTSAGGWDFELTGTGLAKLNVPLDQGAITLRAEQFGRPGARTTILPGGGSQPQPEPGPDPQPSSVTFTPTGGNAWWIQAKVSSPEPLAGVDARVNGGAWKPLALKSWGDWAASIPAPAGSIVQFQARMASGATALSGCFRWTDRAAVACGGGGTTPEPVTGTFAATWKNVRGNEWWIETDVTVSGGTLSGVDARVNGGAWTALDKKSYGSWAKSIHAAPGSTVEFRARATDGAASVSTAYGWPP